MVRDPVKVLERDELVTAAAFETSSPHWALSGALYAFLVIITIVPFLVSCGSTAKSLKEARISAITGTTVFAISIIALIIAELVYFKLFIGKQVPTLAIAHHISPYFGVVFTIIIAIASYSAVSSNLLMITRKFAVDKTKKFNIVSTTLVLIAIILSGTIPFATLVNTLFPILAYSGTIFIALMLKKELQMIYIQKVH